MVIEARPSSLSVLLFDGDGRRWWREDARRRTTFIHPFDAHKIEPKRRCCRRRALVLLCPTESSQLPVRCCHILKSRGPRAQKNRVSSCYEEPNLNAMRCPCFCCCLKPGQVNSPVHRVQSGAAVIVVHFLPRTVSTLQLCDIPLLNTLLSDHCKLLQSCISTCCTSFSFSLSSR